MPTMSPNKDVQKNAQDWVRDLRFSNQVNMQTMGVDTDRVTPQLLLASSNKLLGISKGQQEGDMKDSLQFQRFYGPVEYFAERIQKDGGSVARSILWKATNRGNLDFIGSGSLQPHVNAVFHESNLSQFVDNSTPMDGIDNSQKVTRIGEGGLSDEDSAPIEMRLVQPSYYGYVDPVRTAERSPGITGYLTKNVLKGTDGKLYQKFINMHTGKEELVDAQTAAKNIVTTDEYLDSKDDYVYAIGGPRGLRIVKRSDVDYILPHSDDAFSASANTVPMLSGIKAMRLLMGCHHPETPVAVVDSNGYTHIVPAKRLGHMGQIYVLGCDKKGRDQIYAVRKVITRVPAKKSKFKKVILSSGRVLLTSAEHKWWVYNEKFQLKQAKDLQEGMLVPRSLFSSMPVRLTEIMGVPVTREICVFMGRLIRSLRATNYSYRVDFVKDKERGVDQSTDIVTALEQLGIKNYNLFHSRGIHAVSIKDPVFQDWVNENIGMLPEDRKIPSEILSLPEGYTSIFLDSYYKDLQTIGEDNQGDTWLLSIANPALRDSMSFMLNKIYTDTKYRDYTKKDFVHRALELVPASTSIGDIVLEKITKIMDVQAPPVMIDIDCDDNVYAVANGIITHNSKCVSQAVPLQEREAPLVRGLDSDTGMDMPTKVGKLMGTQWASKPGVVKAVRDDRIDMVYDDGTTGSVPLYKNFPANAKGWLTNYPKVKAGDKVAKGQLLATSNYTDDNGVMATGRNLRVAYMSYHGGTYEDACTLSESAAKKMGYTTMYKTDMDRDKSIRTAKHLYTAWKPGKFTKEQLQNLDDQGVVKVGATINKGDPVILGIRTTEPSPGTLGKRILSDVTEVWEHANPGVVTDVVNGKNGIKVFATVSSPLKEGDKISAAFGNKGTVAQIIPDDMMPRDSKGRPLELLFDPLGIISRCYDDQTEFLTKDGWKFGKDVLDTDILYSYDPNTNTCRWSKQTDKFYKKSYIGMLYGYKNKLTDFLVTEGHKVWTRSEYSDKWHQAKIQDIFGTRCQLPIIADSSQRYKSRDFTLPVVKDLKMTPKEAARPCKFKAKDWAEFLGWYLSEGHFAISDRYAVYISQDGEINPAKCWRIQTLLKRMGVSFNYSTSSCRFEIYGKRLAIYLSQFGKCDQKFIPPWLFKQPWSVVKRFISGLMQGDGKISRKECNNKISYSMAISLTSQKLIDQLQALLATFGVASTKHFEAPDKRYDNAKPMYRLGISTTKRQTRSLRDGWYMFDYRGMVYCPSVETGYVLTRRNGCLICMGNTNPSQMMQAGLGKVAMKTGKPIIVPAFMPKGQSRLKYVKDLMKANNVPWKEDIFDPATGRTIKNVFSGVMYFLPLKHIADTKMSARGTAQYTAQQVPMGGGEQGCFPAMQNIITLHGEQSIAHICEKKIPEYVMSWDEERKEWRWKQITDWFTYRAKVQNILNIFTENSLSTYGGRNKVKHTNSSYPTKNHKMYMADGSIKLAGELKVGDYLSGIGCQYTEDQMQALYGTLMGDSCRTPDGGIQCMHSVKQSAYINYKRDIFAAVGASRVSEPKEVKGGVMGRDGAWKEYKPTAAIRMQVPKSYYVQKALQLTTDSAGKRHLTVPVLEAMGEFGFCLWFLDDGSITNQRKPTHHIDQPQARIATHSFSVQEVEEAAKWLQKNLLHVENGTRISIYKGVYGQDQPCLDFRREASWQIARIIAKHIPWKVIPDSKAWLKQYCKEVQEKTPCVKHNFMSPLGIVPLKIKEIKPYKHDKPNVTEVNVYDFTVEDTHNYALTGGVRVSNSKKIGSLESAALVGHNAFNFLHDAKLIRGQANSDFWRSIRTGQIPTVPGEPLAHKKFFAHLQGSGMQIKRDNEGFTIFALSNKDVNELAGSRQLKSTDTYQQKSFRPIAGGLFGQDIFGPDGDKWAYIQLDSPLPNPVMQEPLARLLGISDTEFQQIVRGKGPKEGLRNASDMKKVLSKMDLQKEANKALAELKTSTKSKKDKALKKYVAIARMRDAGVRPQEYMLDRIPVLPPKFRPITSHGGLTMVADSNYLYSQLLNARDDLREAKDLPEEYQEQGQSNLYQKWKELVGLYDPQDVKLKSKNVKGLLKWALGSNGPKFSAYMQKVLGSTVDTVGRGVIIPSTKIKLNEVGLPVEMAWNLYSPFVVRKLVQQGYAPVDAMEQVKERRPVAAQALSEAIQERPVVMNRAPSLHKLSLMGFNAKLTGGHAIKINPSICPPFNADFDGNCVDFDSEISLKISKSTLDKLEISCSLYQTLTKGSNMPTTKETRIEARQQKPEGAVYGTIKIGEFPRFGTPVKDRNGADVYKVPEGFEVEACDPETGKRGFYPIEALTVENDCDTVKVTVGNHSVIVSSNESLAAFDTATGKLTKVAPKDIGNRLIPVLKKDLTPFGTTGNRDLGWLIGGLISDGWVVGNVVGYAKLEDTKRAEIERIFRELNPNFLIREYKEDTEPGKNKLGESAKIHIYSPEIADYVRSLEILDKEGDKAKKTACSKQINRQMLVNGSEEFLWGLLSGLIDGDGSITVNTTLKNPRFGIRYATSSPSLRDSFCALLYKLGIRYSITTTPPRNWSNEAYTICLSTIDVYANIDKLTCVGSREKELLQKWKDATPVYEDRNDQVPVSDFEWQMLKIVCNNKTDASVYSTCMKKKENRSAMRASILKYKEHLKTAAPSLLKRAEETNTLWYPVDSVEDAGKRQVFDLVVSDAKVFAVNNGLVVWDTVNIHVPVSKKAIQDVRQKMMPERNLISLRKGSILYGPEKGYVQGLYVATRMGESKDVKAFETTADARKAYLKGQIDIDTPIVIKQK